MSYFQNLYCMFTTLHYSFPCFSCGLLVSLLFMHIYIMQSFNALHYIHYATSFCTFYSPIALKALCQLDEKTLILLISLTVWHQMANILCFSFYPYLDLMLNFESLFILLLIFSSSFSSLKTIRTNIIAVSF